MGNPGLGNYRAKYLTPGPDSVNMELLDIYTVLSDLFRVNAMPVAQAGVMDRARIVRSSCFGDDRIGRAHRADAAPFT